jgi:mono/diheme cytochrome c family protein
MRRAALIVLLASPALAVDYVREVRPIFEKHCYECHGPDKQKNGYRLDIKSVALTGGEGHAPNLIAGKSAESPLFRFVSGADKDLALAPYAGSGLYWVEDKTENADLGHRLGLRSILMEHGHNMNHECPYPVVKNWREIYAIITS